LPPRLGDPHWRASVTLSFSELGAGWWSGRPDLRRDAIFQWRKYHLPCL